MKREEFIIYYLLYAFDAANIKKQNLVEMAIKVEPVTFVRIYNVIQQHDENTRTTIISSMLKEYKKEEIIEELSNSFLKDADSSIHEAIITHLYKS